MIYSKMTPAAPAKHEIVSERNSASGAHEAEGVSRIAGDGSMRCIPHFAAAVAENLYPELRAAILRIDELEHDLFATRSFFELARADAALKQREELEAILDELPALLVLDKHLHVVFTNAAFRSQFLGTAEEMGWRGIDELGDAQRDAPRLRALLEEVLHRNSSFADFEITHDFPAVGIRTILLSDRRVGTKDLVLLTIEDVSDRLHFQTTIRRSENRYRRLFETAKDGILIVDPATRKITDCNPFIMELLGYAREEMAGKELWEIGLLKDEAASQDAFLQLRREGYIRYEDLPLKTKNGVLREVEFVSNLYNENGAEVIQCNVRDISGRKHTERALAAANEEIGRHAAELEKVVDERTIRLRETIGELEMFSYSVAHDMRAPLRAMQGFAQILVEDYGANLPNEAREYISYITGAAVRMDMLIEDVLTYSTVLHSEMTTSVVDLDTLVRQIIQTFPQLHTGTADIAIEGVLPKVAGHAAAISQCLSNLLTNAVKFVAPGTAPRVKIWAGRMGSVVRLWVEDNGIGIAPKDQQRIFGMFERVSNDYEGTGIGLAVVRKSIERLRGSFGVESVLGQGSKFWLEFKGV